MARMASDVWAAKGKKIVHFNLKKDDPTDEDLVKNHDWTQRKLACSYVASWQENLRRLSRRRIAHVPQLSTTTLNAFF